MIVACNHVSYLDPVVLGIGFLRPVTYLAKKELFAIPVLGPIIYKLGAYPLDREAGGAAAIRAALRALKEGRCVGIFPEGGRNLDGQARGKGRRRPARCAIGRAGRSGGHRRHPARPGRSIGSG